MSDTTTTIPDGLYYLYPEGSAWIAATFRDGQPERISEQAVQATHDAAGDQWSGMGDEQEGAEEVAADVAAAVVRAVPQTEHSLPENVLVTRVAD